MTMRQLITTLIFSILIPSAQLFSQLRINEIVAMNSFLAVNPVTGQPGDWVEIYNTSSSAISLIGYFLSDDLDNPTRWKFPSDIQIPAGGYLVVLTHGTEPYGNGLHAVGDRRQRRAVLASEQWADRSLRHVEHPA